MKKAELTRWALGSGRLCLFLDYDGTLADFAPTPDDVVTDPEVLRVLEKLARQPTIHVTVLSGRRLEHLRQLVPVRGLVLAGTYGIELLTPSGEMVLREELAEVRPVLEAIKPRWSELIRGRRGFFLEDKGWALALHARFADDEEAEAVLSLAQGLLNDASLISQFRILGGHKFLELAPRLASKKETVEYLLEHSSLSNVRLLYIGDDDKDEEAFPLIHAREGVAVKVLQPSQHSQPSTADLFFDSPAETVSWLEELAHQPLVE
jgi:trehalose 6-phosphate phosphatase